MPRANGGRETVPVHPICHRAIHANLRNAALARIGADPGRLRAEPGIAALLRWIADKAPDFHVPTCHRRK